MANREDSGRGKMAKDEGAARKGSIFLLLWTMQCIAVSILPLLMSTETTHSHGIGTLHREAPSSYVMRQGLAQEGFFH